MNHVTPRDREQARELAKAIFGDYLSEDGREFSLICQALADVREPEHGVTTDDGPLRTREKTLIA